MQAPRGKTPLPTPAPVLAELLGLRRDGRYHDVDVWVRGRFAFWFVDCRFITVTELAH